MFVYVQQFEIGNFGSSILVKMPHYWTNIICFAAYSGGCEEHWYYHV